MDDLLKKIAASAEEIEVPEELKPEKIMDTVERKRRRNKHRKIMYWSRAMAAVAVLVICIAAGWWAANIRVPLDGSSAETQNISNSSGWDTDREMVPEAAPEMEEEMWQAAGQQATSKAEEVFECEIQEEAAVKLPVRQNAGELYTLAEDYGDVMEVIHKSDSWYEIDTVRGDIAFAESEITDGVSGSIAVNDSIQELQEVTEKVTSSRDQYSGTNLQTQGVDESDIVKTDGSFIYVGKENIIYIVDIRSGKLELLSKITLEEQMLELYVDGNKLIAVVQEQNTSMEAATVEEPITKEYASEEKAIEAVPGTDSNDEAVLQSVRAEICVDLLEIKTTAVTSLKTYDITDRSKPKLAGEVIQDGYYDTSRKIGDIVYLFTNYNMPLFTQAGNAAESDVIPLVNGQKIAADCIYLPEQGSRGLLISSVNMDNPDKIVDNIMILHNSVDIYVSTGSLYLYNTVYQQEKQLTQIAKFHLQDGYINAVAAANVEGRVTDTFAIQEDNNCLRLLTTRNQFTAARKVSASLYLFDEKLNLTGQLHDIAPGEEIYAARYLKDTAYFITYRNTDPLFAADISNPAKPTLLGEVEMTGFSDYLHFWDEDSLLGIGYETDPDNGERKGIKLTMFDISDSTDLKIKGNKVLKGCTYCPALDNYKCILVDREKNLIGITTAEYQPQAEYTYGLFTWEENEFAELIRIELPDNRAPVQCRGMYSGSIFYLINEEGIISYNMEEDYRQEKELHW